MPLLKHVEEVRVLDDERAIHRTEAVQCFGVVVDNVKTRGGRALPIESQVGRPAPRAIVVLNQSLRIHQGGEVVGHPQGSEVRHEIALR